MNSANSAKSGATIANAHNHYKKCNGNEPVTVSLAVSLAASIAIKKVQFVQEH